MTTNKTTSVFSGTNTLYEQEFWGISRHELIAGAAERMITQEAHDKVMGVLSGVGASSLADIAGWADRIKQGFVPDQETIDFNSDPRNQNHRSWHFVNLPLGASAYDSVEATPFRNAEDVVQMTIHALEALTGQSDRFSKVNALRILTHLVGDLHQPLHVACGYIDKIDGRAVIEKNPAVIVAKQLTSDRGGNLLDLPNAGKTSLHSYWDSQLGADVEFDEAVDKGALIEKIVEPGVLATVAAFDQPQDLKALPIGWATEAIRAARSAYEGFSIIQTPNQKYLLNWESKPAYDSRCAPIIAGQMKAAARNLALLLQQIFG